MECTRVTFLEVEPKIGIEFIQFIEGCSFKQPIGEGVKQEKESDRATQGLRSRLAFWLIHRNGLWSMSHIAAFLPWGKGPFVPPKLVSHWLWAAFSGVITLWATVNFQEKGSSWEHYQPIATTSSWGLPLGLGDPGDMTSSTIGILLSFIVHRPLSEN